MDDFDRIYNRLKDIDITDITLDEFIDLIKIIDIKLKDSFKVLVPFYVLSLSYLMGTIDYTKYVQMTLSAVEIIDSMKEYIDGKRA